MKLYPWHRWFAKDYRTDTSRLSWPEDLAYRRLLDEYYITGEPLPNNRGQLHIIARASTAQQRKAVDYVAASFFTPDGAVLRNPKADIEIGDRLRLSKQKSENAKGGRRDNADAGTDAQADVHTDAHTQAGTKGPTNAGTNSRGQARRVHSSENSPQKPPARGAAKQPKLFDFDQFKKAYPPRSGTQPWARAAKAANARVKEGWAFHDLLEGASRYGAYCKATGKTGTEFVMQACTFLGPERHFLEKWDLPDTRSENAKAADEAKRILREMDHGRS